MIDFNYLQYSPIRKYEKTNKNHKPKIILAILLLVVVYAIANKLFSNKNQSGSTLSSQSTTISETSGKMSDIGDVIKPELAELAGTYSIYVYNITTKEDFGINEQTVYTAASVNKIPILAALYHLATEKKIDLEETVTLAEADRQDYGSGSIRYDPAGSIYSIKTLARLMMEKSDNTAAYLLGTNIIGRSKISELVNLWGLSQTDISENKTSVADMAILMLKIYKGEIASSAYTLEMLDFMDSSDYDERIPTGVPSNIKVYHKTGDEIGKLHDVGIVDIANNPYFIGIFTLDVRDESATKKAMADISAKIYKIMSQL